MPFQLSTTNHDDSDTFLFPFFLSFIIYLSKSHGGDNYSKTTQARNLKFGQIISLYMNLCSCNFGGATSRGLGHMHPKLVTAKLNLLQRSLLSDFSQMLARVALAEWFKAPVLKF